MNTPLVVGIIAAVITLIGWLVNHILTEQRDRRNQHLAASLKFTERQLEELYGPLAILVLEGKRTFKDLLETLGRNYVFDEHDSIAPDELKLWLFWVENDLFPRNEKIQQLLMTKTHLIEGDSVPASFLQFLEHHNSWKVLHLRWQKEGVAYSWHSKINWPRDFAKDVLRAFDSLKSRHGRFLKKYTDDELADKIPNEPPRKRSH
jgi:hypothetical protein